MPVEIEADALKLADSAVCPKTDTWEGEKSDFSRINHI